MNHQGTSAAQCRPALMTEAIAEYAQTLNGPRIPKATQGFPRYLRQVATAFGWISTSDIPPTAFALIQRQWGSFTARLMQRALAGFVRWARERYAITDKVLTLPLTPVPVVCDRFWDSAVQDRILAAAPQPPTTTGSPPCPGQLTTRGERLRWRNDTERQRALYPVAYVCLRWAVRGIELVALRIGDWDRSARTLTIRRSATRRGNARMITVDAATAAILDAVAGGRPAEELLFRTRRGKPWDRVYLGRQVRKFLRTLGITGSLQDCHRSSIRRMLDAAPDQEEEILAVTGLRNPWYLRTYNSPKRAEAAVRAQSRVLHDTVMSAMHDALNRQPEVPTPMTESSPAPMTDFRRLLTQMTNQVANTQRPRPRREDA